MKFTLATALAVAASTVSADGLGTRATTDTEMGWGKALAGDSKACTDLAVVFARGTFDPGNIGPWVGAPFRDALAAKTKSVSFQGVDPGAYPADLDGYVVEGGSNNCALSLGVVVDAYVKACPKAQIAVTGWSQGALCARKSFGVMSAESASKVIAFVTFGDPYPVWSSDINFPSIPSGAKKIPFCNSAPTDPLCGSLLTGWPTTAAGVVDHLKDIWSNVDKAKMTPAMKSALAAMVPELIVQATKRVPLLATDIAHGHLQRWMLLPQHFWYGMDGSTTKAAAEVVAAMKK